MSNSKSPLDDTAHESNDSNRAMLAPSGAALDLLRDVEVEITLEIGRRRMRIADVLKLTTGQTLELAKAAGEPLDILVNGRLLGRGEAIVVGDKYAVTDPADNPSPLNIIDIKDIKIANDANRAAKCAEMSLRRCRPDRGELRDWTVVLGNDDLASRLLDILHEAEAMCLEVAGRNAQWFPHSLSWNIMTSLSGHYRRGNFS